MQKLWFVLIAALLGPWPALGQPVVTLGSLVSMAQGASPLAPAARPLLGDTDTAPSSMGNGSIVPDGRNAVRALGVDGAAPLGSRRSRFGDAENQRCTPDGRHCIALTSYIPDVCRVIEAAALEAGLDVHFFARLIWRESLFDATAVSHAGAQGIAQFMPATARERGLADPFNPAEALFASAKLLVDLRSDFGNLGYAAAAYNAGGGRVSKFIRGSSRLPGETRAYVKAITGFSAETWRAGKARPDYRLDKSAPFQVACRDMASGRDIDRFDAPADPAPIQTEALWAAVIAADRSPEGLAERWRRIQRRLPDDLRNRAPDYRRTALPGMEGDRLTAQYAAATQDEAKQLCREIGDAGLPCLVHQN